MKIRVKEDVKGTDVVELVFMSVVIGGVIAVAGAPIAGILFGFVGFAIGYPATRAEMMKEAKRLNMTSTLSKERLREAIRNGERKVIVRSELKERHLKRPLLRLLMGEKLVKETTYYIDYD